MLSETSKTIPAKIFISFLVLCMKILKAFAVFRSNEAKFEKYAFCVNSFDYKIKLKLIAK